MCARLKRLRGFSINEDKPRGQNSETGNNGGFDKDHGQTSRHGGGRAENWRPDGLPKKERKREQRYRRSTRRLREFGRHGL